MGVLLAGLLLALALIGFRSPSLLSPRGRRRLRITPIVSPVRDDRHFRPEDVVFWRLSCLCGVSPGCRGHRHPRPRAGCRRRHGPIHNLFRVRGHHLTKREDIRCSRELSDILQNRVELGEYVIGLSMFVMT